MDSFVNIQSVLGPATSQSTDRLRKKVENIEPKTDLDLYVQLNRPESDQPPPRAQYMSWDGTLIEDVGPERKKLMKGPAATSVTISNQDNSKPTQISTSNSTPVKETTAVYTAPVTTPVIQATVHVETSPTREDQAVPTTNTTANSAPIKQLVALYNYDATEENELTFVEGDLIDLLEENESGWWRGRLQVSLREGLFPSNFVEEQGKATVTSGPIEIRSEYVALYDYDAEDNTEISIKENDVLFVESETDGWYYGYNKNTPTTKGNFPSNFVEKKS